MLEAEAAVNRKEEYTHWLKAVLIKGAAGYGLDFDDEHTNER